MASLYDVAARAGVSKTLVSRVVNHQTGVSQRSREKILAAMEELNYVPNALARSLVLQKTGVIGVVLDSLCETYFFDLIRGIEEAIYTSGYDVLFSSANKDIALKQRNMHFFSEGHADGVIMYGSDLNDTELIHNMAKRVVPFVIVENEINQPNINSIVVDNVDGAQKAVDHLVSLGCHKIWHFTGDMGRTVSISRKDGYLNGMRENNLPVSSDMVIESGFDSKLGYLQMKQLIRNNKNNLPDGVFFGGDITAFGALIALQEAGISVPADIKIVGFDDDDPHKLDVVIPKLTTLHQPLYDIGKAAVEMLLSSILHPEQEKQHLVFKPELIIRQSSVL